MVIQSVRLSLLTSFYSIPDGPWIALIKRGSCKFEDKVRHAYNHRAVGVIIYNDRDSQHLDKMQIVDKERELSNESFLCGAVVTRFIHRKHHLRVHVQGNRRNSSGDPG